MSLMVLLVDDEPVFRTYIREMDFWKYGEFSLVGEAEGGDEALAFLEKKKVDMVIMDISMPRMNGVALSNVIARKYPGMAIVAVSSYDAYDYVREILKNGASDYLLKSRLSEDFLISILRNTAVCIKGRSPWEAKMHLRSQAGEWLLGDGANPFTQDNSRKIASVLTIRDLERKEAVPDPEILKGIASMAESLCAKEMDILACTKEPDSIVLLTRFYGTASEAEIKKQLECNGVLIRDAAWNVYHVKLFFYHCPFFFNDNSMKGFLLHKLQEAAGESEEKAILSLSIKQQKRLLAAAEDHDADRAGELIKEIYQKIPGEDMGLCIMTTKELLELIERISTEYQIKLDFLPKEFMLFQYAKMKSREALTSNILGLYKNVLREIGEREALKKGYSDVVRNAILYQNEHYKSPISLRMIAHGIGVNSSYLSRIFHDETGMTVTNYLNKIRVKEAKRLVREKIALKEIVFLCGFRNYGYFLRIFKEYTGQTPKEYFAERERL